MFCVARKRVQRRPSTGKRQLINSSDICCLDEKYFVGKVATILTLGEMKNKTKTDAPFTTCSSVSVFITFLCLKNRKVVISMLLH